MHHTQNILNYAKRFIAQILSAAVSSRKDIILLSHGALILYYAGSDADIKFNRSAGTYFINDLQNLK